MTKCDYIALGFVAFTVLFALSGVYYYDYCFRKWCEEKWSKGEEVNLYEWF